MTLDFPETLKSYFRDTNVALSLSETGPDVPLAYVNPSFCDLTGYAEEELVGINCRILQGRETSEEAKAALHDFVHGKTSDTVRIPVLNYRKDGRPFQNLVFMTRLRDRGGDPRYILASQFDMTSSSSSERAGIERNDARLSRHLSDIEMAGREFGLAMQGSAKALSDSIAMMARLALERKR